MLEANHSPLVLTVFVKTIDRVAAEPGETVDRIFDPPSTWKPKMT